MQDVGLLITMSFRPALILTITVLLLICQVACVPLVDYRMVGTEMGDSWQRSGKDYKFKDYESGLVVHVSWNMWAAGGPGSFSLLLTNIGSSPIKFIPTEARFWLDKDNPTTGRLTVSGRKLVEGETFSVPPRSWAKFTWNELRGQVPSSNRRHPNRLQVYVGDFYSEDGTSILSVDTLRFEVPEPK